MIFTLGLLLHSDVSFLTRLCTLYEPGVLGHFLPTGLVVHPVDIYSPLWLAIPVVFCCPVFHPAPIVVNQLSTSRAPPRRAFTPIHLVTCSRIHTQAHTYTHTQPPPPPHTHTPVRIPPYMCTSTPPPPPAPHVCPHTYTRSLVLIVTVSGFIFNIVYEKCFFFLT